MLHAGEVVRIGGTVYEVAYVNQSRAHLVPLTAKARRITDADGQVREFESTGGAINISPNSLVDTLTEDQLADSERARLQRRIEENMAAGVSPVPVADRSARSRDKARRESPGNGSAVAKRASNGSGRPIRESKKPPTAKDKEKSYQPCLCGCGETTGGFFAMGHDARFKGWMRQIERGEKTIESLPKSIRNATEFKKRGKGFVSVKNYKGETHSGYDR